jgi:NaMN:DMB phosphoribosyltransferase
VTVGPTTRRPIAALDVTAMAAAAAHLDRLTKPPAAWRLGDALVELAGITGRVDAPVARRTVVVAAPTTGSCASVGVSIHVTGQMVANFWPVAPRSTLWPPRPARTSSTPARHARPDADAAPRRAIATGRDGSSARGSGGHADMTEGPAMARARARATVSGSTSSRSWETGPT